MTDIQLTTAQLRHLRECITYRGAMMRPQADPADEAEDRRLHDLYGVISGLESLGRTVTVQ